MTPETRFKARRTFEKNHSNRYRAKQVCLEGLTALIATWEPIANIEQATGMPGEACSIVKRLVQKQRKIIAQLKVMQP